MSAAPQPANKVLLRLVDSSLPADDAHLQASNYEVYLLKYHASSKKSFYCNLNTKSTSWDAPVGTAEATANGKSADELWKDLQDAYDKVSAAQAALLAAEKAKVTLLESLLPCSKSNPVPQPRGGGSAPNGVRSPTIPAPAPHRADSVKNPIRGGGKSHETAAAAATVPVSADVPKAVVVDRPAAPPAVKVFVSWKTARKDQADPNITVMQLTEAFKRFGVVDNAFILCDPLTKVKKPCGFVQFKIAESASQAVAVKTISIGDARVKIDAAKDP
jgi:hypothetical protein